MGCRASNVTAQILMVPGTISRSVSHTIGFQHEPFKRAIRVSNVTMQVMQKSAPPGPARAVTDNLGLVQNVLPFHAVGDREVPENTIGFTDSVSYTILEAGGGIQYFEYPSHTIGFTDSLAYIGPKPISVTTPIGFRQNVSYCLSGPLTQSVSHDMNLKHYLSNLEAISVSHTIGFTHSMARIHPVSHTIGFYDSVNGGVGQDISHTIGFTHSVDPGESLWNYLVSHSIGFQDAVSYYFAGGCEQKQYNRFEGSGAASGIDEEPLTFTGQFALESLEGTRETLYLRSPETDDKQRVGYSRINRESRGGELVVYQDPAWPQTHRLLFTFTALADGHGGSCPDKIGDLQDFFQNHLGQEMLIHDWEGITWKGVIITPNETAVEDRDGWWTISWEFIGEALEGDEMDQHLNFTQTVVVNGDWVRPVSQTIGFTDTVAWSILGQQLGAASQTIGFSQTVTGILEHPTMEDDFSGAGAALDGTSPDVGTGLWAAHSNYLDNGTQTAINSGAYYPFAPVSGKVYEIEWETSAITESDGLETRCFLGEGLPTDPDLVGPTIYGNADPTTLKAGFVLRDLSGTQSNACRLGDHSDGEADTAVFTDATLRTEDDAIDLQLKLDTTGGAGNWKVTWYAKDPASSTWTEVRAEADLIDESITMMGWSNNNTTTTITMDDARIVERTDIT